MRLAYFFTLFSGRPSPCPFFAMAYKKQNAALLPGLEAQTLSCEGAAGIDEVGRGCLAGPVVACAVLLPEKFDLPGLADSKKLSREQREALDPVIRSQALVLGIGVVDAARIDEINILQATFEAMSLALVDMGLKMLEKQNQDVPSLKSFLHVMPSRLFVDGNKTIPADVLARVLSQKLAAENLAKDREERIRIETALAMRPPFRQRAVIGGDALVPAISAASIVAKVYRDAFMDEMDRAYPGYGFAAHKGYGTKEHLKALQELGPCPLHRLSFKGVPKGVSRTKSS